MQKPEPPITSRYETSESPDGGITLHILGDMDATNADSMIEALTTLLRDRSPSSLTVDLAKVDYLDDF